MKIPVPKIGISFKKIADFLLGESPPSLSELEKIIEEVEKKKASGLSLLAPGSEASESEVKEVIDEIKNFSETKKSFNEKLTKLERKTLEFEKDLNEMKETLSANTKKIEEIERNMKKFLSLYELVTNQVNPFVEPETKVKGIEVEKPKEKVEKEKVAAIVSIKGSGSETKQEIKESKERPITQFIENNSDEERKVKVIDVPKSFSANSVIKDVIKRFEEKNAEDDSEGMLPLRHIKNDLTSLVIVLEWMKYLVDKAGTRGAREILKHYVRLGWITPEVYKFLSKYIIGPKNTKRDYTLTFQDHVMSLFFISRLKGFKFKEEDYHKWVKELEL